MPVRLCCRCQGSAEMHAGLQQATGPVRRSLAESLTESLAESLTKSLAQPQLLQTLEKGTYGQICVIVSFPFEGRKEQGRRKKS